MAQRRLFGARYVLPPRVMSALEQMLDTSVRGVRVIEYSPYARAHLGMSATTPPNRILLAAGGAEFIANPEMVLHEYFHVVRQWNPGYLSRRRYLLESMRFGYWENRYEREAREFAAAAVGQYCQHLGEAGD